jgi:hypothetical protein
VPKAWLPAAPNRKRRKGFTYPSEKTQSTWSTTSARPSLGDSAGRINASRVAGVSPSAVPPDEEGEVQLAGEGDAWLVLVIARLEEEGHHAIHDVLEGVDRGLVA